MIKTLTLMLLVIVFLCVQSVKAEPGNDATQQQSPGATGSIQPPSATANATPVNDAKVKNVETPVPKAEGYKEPGKAISRAEGLQIAISFVLLLVVFGQLRIYKQQRKIMQKQIDNFEVTERAYIGVVDMLLDLRHGFTVVVVCQNGGRTPAWDIGCTANVVLNIRRSTWLLNFPKALSSFLLHFKDDWKSRSRSA